MDYIADLQSEGESCFHFSRRKNACSSKDAGLCCLQPKHSGYSYVLMLKRCAKKQRQAEFAHAPSYLHFGARSAVISRFYS